MDVADLLTAEASADRIVKIAHTALAQHGAGDGCSIYLLALDMALRNEPPPFGTEAYAELYRGASEDPHWLAISLITNAEREGDGAKRLWSLAACSPDPDYRRRLKIHAVDESRHALIYLGLLDLAFPEKTDPAFRLELNQLSPFYTLAAEPVAVEGSPYAKEPTIDDFLQMNIAEIRTTIHHLMHRRALAIHAPPERREQITMIQDSLLRDELAHVAYTAMLIEQMARNGHSQSVFSLFAKRFRDFNRITNEELGEFAFDCSVGCCERHPSCRSKAVPFVRFADSPI